MARKSRRSNSATSDALNNTYIDVPEKNSLRTALYARLSVEQDDNDTIQNQVALLRNFVLQQGDMVFYRLYEDNGFTGTNFERPAFQEMMEDIRSGLVQCVVVKDLSRLGRNFIETGFLIETLFPKLNVRLISINDCYDSSRQTDQNDISVPVKNMVNEMYAKDISKKICASKEARRKNGDYTIEKSIYGYAIDKEKNQFILNPDTAPVVVVIFKWFLDGVMTSEIARRLNLLGIDTPMTYKYENEFHMPLYKKQYWDSSKVRKILTQEAYAGDRILGARRNRLYKNQHKQKLVPREEWTIYKDDHTALISKDDYMRTQAIIQEQRQSLRKAKEVTDSIEQDRSGLFSNLVYCKSCGILMYHQILKYHDGRIKPEGGTYDCRGRAQIENRRGCGLRIKDGYLQALVAGQVKLLINTVVDRDAAIQKVRRLTDDRNPIYRMNAKIRELDDLLNKCDEKILKLYEDLTAGLLEQDDYSTVRRHYQKERIALKEQLGSCRQELQRREKTYRKIHDLVTTLKPHMEQLSITRELVDLLIERIEVDKDLNIEIIFKCRDVFEDCISEGRAGEKI